MAKDKFGYCTKCGADDWYTYGKYTRCRPCNNEAVKRHHERKKLGIPFESKKPRRPSLARDLLTYTPPNGRDNRKKKKCPQGHWYDEENTNYAPQGANRTVNRDCRQCDRDRKNRQYGLSTPKEFDLGEVLKDLEE